MDEDIKPDIKPVIEETPKEPDDKKTNLCVALKILKKYNLNNTAETLKKEANLTDSVYNTSEHDVNNALNVYKSQGDPSVYENAYITLSKFVDTSLDIYKHELGCVLYPVFVHMYLDLVSNGHETEAVKFIQKFGPGQESYYQNDIRNLAIITKKEELNDNTLVSNYKSDEFVVRMSRDTLSLLKRHLKEKKQTVLLDIVQEHLFFDVYEGIARNKQQIDAVAGGMIGEGRRKDNQSRVYYGLMKEPDLQTAAAAVNLEEDEEETQEGERPKKKKSKSNPLLSKKTKIDPNAPPLDRMALPQLREIDKKIKVQAVLDSAKRVALSPETLPSVCCYTLLNCSNGVNCATISDDATMLAVGLANSRVRVWSLVPQKLRAMKTADQLLDIDLEADDVMHRILDDRSAETTRTLLGHYGPVYQVSFSPDKTLLLSCSEDCTIRLWSLLLWSCVVAYKGSYHPVWDVKFSLHGYYFATASRDRTARLWATDNYQSLRLFSGHFSDVDCCQFHPNSNYIATGSSDRTVRLWDCVTGEQVRLMTGHKGEILTLCFSNEGRVLASAGNDCNILLWDIAHGHLVAMLTGHKEPIYTITFSRDSTILASGSHDCKVMLWDYSKLLEDLSLDDMNVHNPTVLNNGDKYLLRAFGTKNSPVIHLFFSRRNIMFCVCSFNSPQPKNLNKLKKLEYLNLALNCIEKIENLDRCESLNKLDLTMNFIGELTSVESLKHNIFLRTLYLTGNPCTDYDGYREFVVGILPQIDVLDGIEVTHYDKLVAKQLLSHTRCKIVAQQKAYEKSKMKNKKSSTPLKIIEESLETDDQNHGESNDDFWNQPSENTPECRVQMAMHSRRAQRKQDEAKKTPKEEKRIPKLFADNGRPYNINQAKVSYTLENEQNKYVLTVQIYKFMDTSELDVDVQPSYVRVTVRKKILQLSLDEEVKVDESCAKRLIGSKLLEITMPKVKQIISPAKKQRTKNKDISRENKSKLTDEVLDGRKSVEFWNITNERTKTIVSKKFENFVDNPEVPPLE